MALMAPNVPKDESAWTYLCQNIQKSFTTLASILTQGTYDILWFGPLKVVGYYPIIQGGFSL